MKAATSRVPAPPAAYRLPTRKDPGSPASETPGAYQGTDTASMARTTDSRKRRVRVARCKAERTADGRWAITVIACPWCAEQHYHGGQSGDVPELGSRLSHCADIDLQATYELRLTTTAGGAA